MEECLIEKVRLHELLYNNRSINYRDQNMRQQAWQQIAEELETTAAAVKTIWDKLRRCFLNALHRRRNKKSGALGKKIPSWKYETQMSFLLPYLDSRNTESNITGDVNSTEDTQVEQEPNDEQEDADDQKPSIIEENNETQDVSSGNVKTLLPPQNACKKTKRATAQDSLKDMADAIKENANLRKRKLELKEQDKRTAYETLSLMDETDMFFASMSKMTKTLPFLEQIKIKKLLSNAVLDAQMSQYCQDQNYQSAFS